MLDSLVRTLKFYLLFFLTYSIILSSLLYSASSTGAQFLKLAAGARATGMGESFVAVANDATAIFWNPAGISSLTSKEFSASHHSYVQSINYETIAYVHPIKVGAFGSGVHYLYLNDIERRDKSGNLDGSFGASDFAFTFSFARVLFPANHISGGVNLKAIRLQIDSFHANAFALDFGVLAPILNSGFTFGLSLQNIGTDVQFLNESFSLPRTLKTGLSWSNKKVPLTLASSIVVPKAGDISYQFGSELWMLSSFALRAGYMVRSANDFLDFENSYAGKGILLSQFSGFMAGAGVKFLEMQLDYSLTPLGDLGSSHRVTLGMKFK